MDYQPNELNDKLSSPNDRFSGDASHGIETPIFKFNMEQTHTGVIILQTQTMNYYEQMTQNYLTFVLFDSPIKVI